MPAGTPRRRAGDHHLDQRELAYQAPREFTHRKIPPARPADRSASDYIPGSAPPKIPPARPADRSVSDYIPERNLTPKIPPACPADHSVSDYIPRPPHPKIPPACRRSFGFGLHPRRLTPKSRRLARQIVRFRTTSAARPLPESRRLARRIIRLPDYIRGSTSPRIPRLARRIVRFRTTSAARPLPESRRLARRIIRKIPPARPANHSASDYIRGSASLQNPAGSPGGSFTAKSRRLARRILLRTTSAAQPLPESRRLARRIIHRKIPPLAGDHSASD